MNKLEKLEKRLEHLKNIYLRQNYHIPSYWDNPLCKNASDLRVNPFDFFLKKIKEIRHLGMYHKAQQTHKNIVYNMLVRYTVAYDHNADKKIEIGLNAEGFRETGTFLKATALLPYIHSLGCDTIYLLPVTSIGVAGKKGNLGSPYAIADPYQLDKNLDEPILEMPVEDQFAAFVEAAHIAGFKVVMEFVFRTASIDTPLAFEHPEWFYWIRDEVENRVGYYSDSSKYGPPYFDNEKVMMIKDRIDNNLFSRLPEPDKNYKKLFTDVPVKIFKENGLIKGITKQGIKCKISSAFADWPPDDNQPVWSDVTYLRMYNNPRFNYVAYNTIRMYDTSLATTLNAVKSLWEHIEGIVPYYQKEFSIDGVMIDMGHALPAPLLKNIIKKARVINPNFIIWEENFYLSKESKDKGFDASLGYMPFDAHIAEKMKGIVDMLVNRRNPIPFFLTAETHNTKRAAERPGGIEFSKYVWGINCFMPGLLFVHSGFELAERKPVNTGLQFTDEEIESYPADILPLFSVSSLNWMQSENIIDFMRQMLKERQCVGDVSDSKLLASLNPKVIAIKITNKKGRKFILLAAPYSQTNVNTMIFLDEDFELLKTKKKDYKITDRELLLKMGSQEIIIGLLK